MSEVIDSSKIRNIAIIAHVDHGKTTLVDFLLKQSGMFRGNEHVEERMMDSMDLEKERGITIQAKNASFIYKDIRINIVDTPGHSDFGGEVERVLNMVDGTILLVDAAEGPLPQTRFVLKKAMDQNKKVIVCINKIDRHDARPDEVLNEIFDLFIDLDANEEQADFPYLYAVAREGYATQDYKVKTDTLQLLYDWIIEKFPAPKGKNEAPLQIMVSNIDYNDYVGRLAIGRIQNGIIRMGDEVLLSQADNKTKKGKITALFKYDGLKQVPAQALGAGDVAIVAGFEDITIGDTVTSVLEPMPLTRIKIEEPTVSIMLGVNNGPFAGKEGKKVTSRNILERLERELRYNVSIRVEPTSTPETFKIIGRGELQLAVLIEQMRREGFEMIVGKPQVVLKTINGELQEPMEKIVVDVSDLYQGAVAQKIGIRKGIMTNMHNKGSGRVRMEYLIPARGLIGYRSEFLTDTRGTGLLNTEYAGYGPHRGEIIHRTNGAMVSDRLGKTTAYAVWNLQERGRIFIVPPGDVYEGMIIGENAKENDLVVNCCREKKLTNVRASGSDEAIKLVPVKPPTLEQGLEWINDDEVIEVTPLNIRLRCLELNPHKRGRKAEASE